MAMTPGELLRVRFLFGALGCVPLFLAGWFGWLQVLQKGALEHGGRTLPLCARTADVQRERSEGLPGPRGTIVDRHGAVLAMDCSAYEVRAELRPPGKSRADCADLRGYLQDMTARLADALARDPGLSDRAESRARFRDEIGRRVARCFSLDELPTAGPLPKGTPAYGEFLVAGDVSVLSVVEALRALDEEWSSLHLSLRHTHTRSYPQRDVTYGFVGYLEDAPVRDDRDRVVRYDQYAPMGLEAVAALLPGATGRRSYRVDAKLRPFFDGPGALSATPATMESTIDVELQKVALRELERQVAAVTEQGSSKPAWAALVVVEIETGDVMAAASWVRDTEQPRGAAFTPYQSLYEPGSIVKPLVFALATQLGKLDWEHVYDCSSSGSDHHLAVEEAGGRIVRDDHGCGRLDARGILVNSSNIGAIKVGAKLERDEWRRWLDVYGFGQSLGLPMPHERTGGPSKKGWLPGITAAAFRKWTGASYSIGYELQVNALQMARAYLTMLSGCRRELRVVRSIEVDGVRREVPIERGEVVFDPLVVATVTEAMRGVICDEEGATGRHVVTELRKEGIELMGLLGGKTGTAKSYTTMPGKGTVEVRNASFVGFLPVEAPRYLGVCVLQKDDSARFYGGSYAAPPVARTLVEAMRLEERRRLRQEPQVSASPGASGRSPRVPETSQAGR